MFGGLSNFVAKEPVISIMRFEELDLSDEILDAIDAMNFGECTPIQEQTIPVILEGHDLIACAQTGTGKTAAFLLPIIDRISGEGFPTDAINCLVIAPTRELARQIDRQMDGFSYFLPVNSLAIFGGTDGPEFARQQKGLKEGADVVIATPGRLIDHIQMGYVDLSQVAFLVLDEADRMLDMGFYDDIKQIVNLLPRNCQKLLFSATMPPKTRKLATEILRDPKEINIAVSRPIEKIQQSAYVCYEPQKTPILRHIFKSVARRHVIVFASSKQKVKELTRELRRMNIKAAEIHSDLEQSQRDEVMLDFRAHKVDVLVATDILARGIDIDDIAMVVNYDVPRETESYIHRIGRTARANADGVAVTLVSPRDIRGFAAIEKFLGYEIMKAVVPESFGETPTYSPNTSSGASKRRPGNRRNRNKKGDNRPAKNKQSHGDRHKRH